MTKRLYVMGRYDKDTQGFTLSSNKAILNCTLSGLEANHDYTLNLTTKQPYVLNNSFAIETDENGTCAIVIATFSGNYERIITIKDGTTEVGTIDLGTRAMTAKVYNVKRNYGRAAFGKFIDISTLTADFEAQDGDVLSGTLGGEHKISIAAGATVTLDGVTINDNGNVTDNDIASDDYCGRLWENGIYAGLTCLGSATIILKDGSTNTVRGFYFYYPGIQAGPSGTTLTIRGGSQGTGQLFASSQGGAGIGSASSGNYGDITIEGGTVNAASFDGAGIGTGAGSTCGNISITGGSVTAKGGTWAAGIGTGRYGTCGSIKVERKQGASTQSVTVTADRSIGNGAGGYDIGKGVNGTIKDGENNGTVSVGSNVKTSGGKSYSTSDSSEGYNHN